MKNWTIAFGIVAMALTGCTTVPESEAEALARVDAICCGSSCCAIEGGCQSNGDENPANACEICNPAVSQTAWSANPTCEDAGPPAVDAGPVETDAGPVETDAGPVGTDAGSTTPPPSGGGGGCAVNQGQSYGAWILGVLGALFLATRRRRR
jgi:hypothetical protein